MPQRPLRADAQRNRDRLVETAVRAFSQEGPDVTLDSVAKAAGVGIGTLYRHFPTREALIEAAYRNELTKLTDVVGELLETLPPDQALRAWMDHFFTYMTTKKGMGDALKVVIASGVNPFAHSRELMVGAITRLLGASAAAGVLRDDIGPEDLLTSLGGIALAVSGPEQRETATRLLDLLMDGLRYRATAAR
ncbi:MAG: TetR/AcrR family transcriptional regulator [Kibdelosporangium sp.]